MKMVLRCLSLFALVLCLSNPLLAQRPQDIIMTESGPTETEEAGEVTPPLDDVTEKTMMLEKPFLKHEHIREADIFWQKRIWRVVDIREKMNLTFAYPERPFFTILMEAAQEGEITVYSQEDDKFSSPLSSDEVLNMGATRDTVITFDPETYEEQIQVVTNEINPEDVRRFRIKEDWVFDEESSTLQVRILGIAPLIDVTDENTGEFLYELPLFWVYYPDAREMLSREQAYIENNDAATLSWEDILEMRFFSSYIYKQSNVHDRRLQEYLSGVDLLMEAEKIKSEIFNFEHDLWTY